MARRLHLANGVRRLRPETDAAENGAHFIVPTVYFETFSRCVSTRLLCTVLRVLFIQNRRPFNPDFRRQCREQAPGRQVQLQAYI